MKIKVKNSSKLVPATQLMEAMMIVSSLVLLHREELKTVAKESRDHFKGLPMATLSAILFPSPQPNKSSKSRPEFLNLCITDILGK